MFIFPYPQALVPIVAILFLVLSALTFSLSIYIRHPVPAYWKHGIRNIAGALGAVGMIRLVAIGGWITPSEVSQYTALALLAFALLLAENVYLCRAEHRYIKRTEG